MAWVAAGAAIVGDIMASQGQSAANESNAQQAELNREFQAEQTAQARQYDTYMSNTAEQRRMADLKAAGLNPQLAVGNPASSPSSPAASGAQATYQNAGASFGSLGGQITNALTADAQIKNLKAQTDLTTNQTPGSDAFTLDADNHIVVGSLTGAHKLGDLTAMGLSQDIQNKQSTANLINTQVQSAQKDVDLKAVELEANKLSLQSQQALLAASIKAQKAALETETITQENVGAVMGKTLTVPAGVPIIGGQSYKWGEIISVLEAVLGHASTAVSTYNKAQYPTAGH